MKKILCFVALLGIINFASAQNTFPASGNVGIGAGASPTYQLTTTGQAGKIASFGNDQPYTSQVFGSFAGRALFGYNGTTQNAVIQGIGSKGIEFNINNDTFGSGQVMVISTSGRIGIGTTAPNAKLHIVTTALTAPVATSASADELVLENGTNAGLTIRSSETGTGNIYFGDVSSSGSGRVVYDHATDALQFTTSGFINTLTLKGGNVGIGTTDTKGYKFAINGSAVATSMTVKLNSAWPDYVFKEGYKRPTLTEVKDYIDNNHHLPDMPSAAQVEKDGLNLGEINTALTKKVEELTLYLVEKDQQLKSQEARMSKLEKAFEEFKKGQR